MSYHTRQKSAVTGILKQSGSPLTADQIHIEATKLLPEIGLSTVYRILKSEIAQGRIQRVEIPGAGVVYELNDTGHHHYFVCDECHSVLTVNGCVDGIQNILPKGSRMHRHEFLIYGECPDCADR